MILSSAARPAEPIRPVAVVLRPFDMAPGREGAFQAWIVMLHARQRDAVATVPRERTYLEAMLTAPDEPRRLYWLTVQGAGGKPVESATSGPDRRHMAYIAELLVTGSHRRLETRNVLAPYFMAAAS